jgi:holliday junction DNA helicase RuvA
VITRVTGTLNRLHEDTARLEIGALEYEVLIPEFVRRQLQSQLGQTISLKTIEYLEGNPQQGRMVPRLVGFLSEAELEFFEMVCSVDGVGVRKALRAMVRPVREVADAIEQQNHQELTLLPGIGPALAERIVAKLRRKMAKFALMVQRESPAFAEPEQSVSYEALQALISLGHTSAEAQDKIDAVLKRKAKFKTVEDLLREIYLTSRD